MAGCSENVCYQTVPSATTGAGQSALKKTAVQKPKSETDESDSDESDNHHEAKAVAADRKSTTGKVLIFIILITFQQLYDYKAVKLCLVMV